MTGKLAPEVHTTAVHPNPRDDLDVHELDGEALIFDPLNEDGLPPGVCEEWAGERLVPRKRGRTRGSRS